MNASLRSAILGLALIASFVPTAALAAGGNAVGDACVPGVQGACNASFGLTCDANLNMCAQSATTNSVPNCDAATGVCSCSATNQSCPSGQTCDLASGSCRSSGILSTTCTPACGSGQTCDSGICRTNVTTVTPGNTQSDAIDQCSGDSGFVSLSCIPGFADATKAGGLATFFNLIYKLCIGAAAVIAVLQITRAGILYMGSDSFTEKKDAKHLIWVSLLGLVLVLSPALIISIINPSINTLNIDTTGLTVSSDGSAGAGSSGQKVGTEQQTTTVTGATLTSNLKLCINNDCSGAKNSSDCKSSFIDSIGGTTKICVETCVDKTTLAENQSKRVGPNATASCSTSEQKAVSIVEQTGGTVGTGS